MFPTHHVISSDWGNTVLPTHGHAMLGVLGRAHVLAVLALIMGLIQFERNKTTCRAPGGGRALNTSITVCGVSQSLLSMHHAGWQYICIMLAWYLVKSVSIFQEV